MYQHVHGRVHVRVHVYSSGTGTWYGIVHYFFLLFYLGIILLFLSQGLLQTRPVLLQYYSSTGTHGYTCTGFSVFRFPWVFRFFGFHGFFRFTILVLTINFFIFKKINKFKNNNRCSTAPPCFSFFYFIFIFYFIIIFNFLKRKQKMSSDVPVRN